MSIEEVPDDDYYHEHRDDHDDYAYSSKSYPPSGKSPPFLEHCIVAINTEYYFDDPFDERHFPFPCPYLMVVC